MATYAAARPSGRHIPALDGLRGIAILLVLAFHCRSVFSSSLEAPYLLLRGLDLGWSGVDLFFVLSGFLITGILLDSRDSPTYFKTFYLRRALRIFPLYFAYLFLILVVVRHLGPDLWSSTNPWWYATYLLNWKADHGYNDLYLGHLWSLAIEEQFYFIWPLVVWLTPRRWLRWVCLVVAVLALGFRCFLEIRGQSPEAIYRLTLSRMDALALGALVATGVRDFRAVLDRWAGPVLAVCGLGFLGVVANLTAGYWNDVRMRTVGASLLEASFACVVFMAATRQSGALGRALRSPFLRKFGKYSYAMYVLHSVPYNLTVEAVGALRASGLAPALILLLKCLYFPAIVSVAFGAAWVSWRVIEEPFLKLKRFFPYLETQPGFSSFRETMACDGRPTPGLLPIISRAPR
jgi:peptidoglycan/LPS O-acetylase OafA/YrhL